MGLIKGAIKLAIAGGLVYYASTYGCNAIKKADYKIRNKAPKAVADDYDKVVEKGKEAALSLLKKGKEDLEEKLEGDK